MSKRKPEHLLKDILNALDETLIRGFRNRLAHEYFRLDHRILWQVVQDDLPILKQHLSAIKFD